MQAPSNEEIARQFREAAELLEGQGADRYRVGSYHRAANTIASMRKPIADRYHRGGLQGLIAVPTIGRAFAMAIEDIVEDGRWRWLERLRGEVDPEAVLATVAGVGPVLAERAHHELGIETLEDLEVAAHDGRLAEVPGFGPRRVQAVVDSLAGRFRRRGSAPPPHRNSSIGAPSTQELLDVDREYRRRVAEGSLQTIAPRRFNPAAEAWLPVLHTVRGERHYTALFSNTARAHRLGRTDDWVVIYIDGPDDGQWTAVTETRGPLEGQRVVRGREFERCETRPRPEPWAVTL